MVQAKGSRCRSQSHFFCQHSRKLFVDLLLDFLNQLPDGKSNHMVSRFPSFGVFMKVFVRSPELFLAH